MFSVKKIAELKFTGRTSEFGRTTELKIANEQIIKKYAK